MLGAFIARGTLTCFLDFTRLTVKQLIHLAVIEDCLLVTFGQKIFCITNYELSSFRCYPSSKKICNFMLPGQVLTCYLEENCRKPTKLIFMRPTLYSGEVFEDDM